MICPICKQALKPTEGLLIKRILNNENLPQLYIAHMTDMRELQKLRDYGYCAKNAVKCCDDDFRGQLELTIR